MSLSNSTNYVTDQLEIISRALRLTGELGQGEAPNATQLAEGAVALNHLTKRFQVDGMQLWRRSPMTITPVAGQGAYLIGIGQPTNTTAPLRVYDAYRRTNSVDTPLMIITRQEYDAYPNKSQPGTPNLVYYQPPGPNGIGFTDEMRGTLYMTPVPDANFAAANTVIIVGQLPIQDFDSNSDYPDFPSYWFNALVWNLAAELCFEGGLPLQERALIAKKAEFEHNLAMSYDYEEGSIFIQPRQHG